MPRPRGPVSLPAPSVALRHLYRGWAPLGALGAVDERPQPLAPPGGRLPFCADKLVRGLSHQPVRPSPLAEGASARISGLTLLQAGDAFYRAGAHKQTAAIDCWLRAGMGTEQERVRLYLQLAQQFQGDLNQEQAPLLLFHMARLSPGQADATLSMRAALSADGRLVGALEQLLVRAKKENAGFANQAPKLYRNLGSLVGEGAALQARMVEALRQQDYVYGYALADHLQFLQPHLMGTRWVMLTIAMDAADLVELRLRGVGEIGEAIQQAREVLQEMVGWDSAQQARAQGALSKAVLQHLWETFLQTYAAVAPQDFQAPETNLGEALDETRAAHEGEDTRCWDGMLWPDLLALACAKVPRARAPEQAGALSA